MGAKTEQARIQAEVANYAVYTQATSPTEMASITGQTQVGIISAIQNAMARIQEAMYQYKAILSNNETDLAIAHEKYLLGLDQNKVKLAENETAMQNALANRESAEAEKAKQSAKVATKALSEGYYDGNLTVDQDDGDISITV